MSNPISGGGASNIAMQQLQKMQEMQSPQEVSNKGNNAGVSKFQQTMQTKEAQQIDPSQKVQTDMKLDPTKGFRKVAEVAKSQKVQDTQATQKTQSHKVDGNKKDDTFGHLDNFLNSYNSRKTDVNQLMKQALNGKAMSQKQVLIMQYKVSMFTMEAQLAGKVVESSSGGLKQIMQTQV